MKKKPDNEQVDFLYNLLSYNVRAIVEHEGEVRIELRKLPARVVFTVYVAPTDIGLVLGNEGATLNALRRLVWTASKKTHLKCDIDFI